MIRVIEKEQPLKEDMREDLSREVSRRLTKIYDEFKRVSNGNMSEENATATIIDMGIYALSCWASNQIKITKSTELAKTVVKINGYLSDARQSIDKLRSY
jgi:hypothetical protein